MKNEKYIKKIKTLAETDIMFGRADKLRKDVRELLRKEDYETCAGIKRAFESFNMKL